MAGTREPAHLHAFNLRWLESVRIDGSALVFTLLAASGCGVLFGLLPALLLVGAGLPIRSFLGVPDVNPGFQADRRR